MRESEGRLEEPRASYGRQPPTRFVLDVVAGQGVPRVLSYYDAQIWAVARLGQVDVVLSEDFNPGAVLEGVRFANPLDPAFDPSSLR